MLEEYICAPRVLVRTTAPTPPGINAATVLKRFSPGPGSPPSGGSPFKFRTACELLIHPGFFGGNTFVQVRLFGRVSQVIDRIQDGSRVTDRVLGVLWEAPIDLVKDIVPMACVLNIGQVLEERCSSFPGRVGVNQIHETVGPVAVDGFAGQGYPDVGFPDSSG